MLKNIALSALLVGSLNTWATLPDFQEIEKESQICLDAIELAIHTYNSILNMAHSAQAERVDTLLADYSAGELSARQAWHECSQKGDARLGRLALIIIALERTANQLEFTLNKEVSPTSFLNVYEAHMASIKAEFADATDAAQPDFKKVAVEGKICTDAIQLILRHYNEALQDPEYQAITPTYAPSYPTQEINPLKVWDACLKKHDAQFCQITLIGIAFERTIYQLGPLFEQALSIDRFKEIYEAEMAKIKAEFEAAA